MLDRKTQPPFNSSTSFHLLEPTVKTLANGLTLQFISGGEQEVVRVEIIFDAGRWTEDLWGTSHFSAGLLNKGTTNKSSFEIAQIFDQYGAHVEVTPGLDVVSVSIYSLTKNIQPVLQLFFEIVTSAIFPEKELRQSKSIFLQNLKVNQEKTSFVASSIIRKNLFGENHPYGKELEEADVSKLERQNLVNFYTQNFKATHVFVSGKISEHTRKLLEDTFSQLPVGKTNQRNHKATEELAQPVYIEKEGSSQTSLRLGKKSIMRSHVDYADVLFLNHILGGYFGSRLMKNIREDKGLSYGIYSALHALQHDSYIVIGADVNKENRELATQEIRNEVKRLSAEEVGQHELTTARLHFIGSLQSEITTPFAHADKLKNITLNKLDKNYYQNLIHRINTITAPELILTAQKYYSEESLCEVAVG
ncbi:MAG TPA: pitrilysin family protein [Cyclobacteriaceae bacterium]